MSRGGRGGRGGGGRGSFGGGRGGFGSNNPPPMGLSFADIQGMSREPSALYPPMDPLPVLTEYSADEKRIAELQSGFISRLRKSAYYIVEQTKSTEIPRYSDKYRESWQSRPTLVKKDLHQPFFPPNTFEEYFHPKKKRKIAKTAAGHLNIDALVDEGEDNEKSDADRSDVGSQVGEDYDDDEDDNDYAGNYFDTGEADDFDDLGEGLGGGEDGGGAADYD